MNKASWIDFNLWCKKELAKNQIHVQVYLMYQHQELCSSLDTYNIKVANVLLTRKLACSSRKIKQTNKSSTQVNKSRIESRNTITKALTRRIARVDPAHGSRASSNKEVWMVLRTGQDLHNY